MVQRGGDWAGPQRRSPPRLLLALPNVTLHPLTASVPITVLLYNGPLLCAFCRAMLCKRGLCCQPVMRCVCLCACVWVSVTFVHSVKMNKRIFKMFSPSSSHTILVLFHIKRHGNIPTGTPLTGASNACGVCRNRDSEPISGLTACCEAFQRWVQYT